jgi:hypothetical protein
LEEKPSYAKRVIGKAGVKNKNKEVFFNKLKNMLRLK